MPARVMLLVLTVGLFIAIWSSDRGRVGTKPAGDAVAKNRSRRNHVRRKTRPASSTPPQQHAARTTPLTPRPKPVVSPLPRDKAGRGVVNSRLVARMKMVGTSLRQLLKFAERGLPRVTPVASATTASTSEESARRFPLPGGLTPGVYRVVRSDGRVWRMRLTAAELARRGFVKPKAIADMRMLHDGTHRWYFIRVASAKIPGIYVRRTKSMRSPVVARRPVWIDASKSPGSANAVATPKIPAIFVRRSNTNRKPVVAQRPMLKDRSKSLGSSNVADWFARWDASLRTVRADVIALPGRAGRMWWAAFRQSLDRWSNRAMQPPRTAGKKHPLRD